MVGVAVDATAGSRVVVVMARFVVEVVAAAVVCTRGFLVVAAAGRER